MTIEIPPEGRLAGIDYGTVRIGIAVTDPERRFASPYENYTRRDLVNDAKRFKRLVEEERIVGFVLGLPVHTSGEESQKSYESRQFAAWLSEQTSRPVVFIDERYTSVFAEQMLGEVRMTSKQRKARRDMLAAQILLTAFIEQNRRTSDSPGALSDEGR